MVTRAKRFGLNDYFGAGQTAYPWLVLDRLSARPYSAWSFARRMTRRWNGPVGRLYRTSDGVEADVYGRGRLGLVDPWAIRAWNGWNKIRNSVFEHAGGTAPSNFTANDTGGAAIASTLFPGETAWSFNAVGDRPFLVQVNIPVKAGYTYSLSFEVESVTGRIGNGRRNGDEYDRLAVKPGRNDERLPCMHREPVRDVNRRCSGRPPC